MKSESEPLCAVIWSLHKHQKHAMKLK